MLIYPSHMLAPGGEGWRDQAACRNTDPDLFFPIGSTGVAVEQTDQAKAVCAACAVRGPCLQYALDTNQEAGVWGGASEEERRKLRAKRAALRRQALVSR